MPIAIRIPMRAILALLLAFPILAAELSEPQEAELAALRSTLWDQGYTEAEIEARVEARRKEMLTPASAPAKKDDPELAKLKSQLRGLGERGILPKAYAESRILDLEKEWGRALPPGRIKLKMEYRKKMRDNVRAWWKQSLVQSGRTPQDAEAYISAKEAELAKEASRMLKKGASLDELPQRMKERFPEIPPEIFDLGEQAGTEAVPAPAVEPVLSEDEVDEIVDELLRELEESPPQR